MGKHITEYDIQKAASRCTYTKGHAISVMKQLRLHRDPTASHVDMNMQLIFHALGLDAKEVRKQRRDIWDVARDCANRSIPAGTLRRAYASVEPKGLPLHAQSTSRKVVCGIFRVSRFIPLAGFCMIEPDEWV